MTQDFDSIDVTNESRRPGDRHGGPHDPAPAPSLLACFDHNVAKPTKALIGLGLLFAVSFALYGYNHMEVVHDHARPAAVHHAHYAPSEDNAIE